MNYLRRFCLTLIASLFTLIVVLTAMFSNIDLIKLNLTVFEGIEKHEVYDIIGAILLLIVALASDWMRASRKEKRKAEIQAEKLAVLKATIRTVQDTVNNALNNLKFLRLEAEGALPTESLELLDAIIQETSVKLKALGDLEDTPKKQVVSGVGIDYSSISTALLK